MANQNYINPPAVQQETEDIDWLSIVRACTGTLRRQWRWFAFSIIVCGCLAFLYERKQPRVYQRQAVIEIEGADGSSGSRRMPSNMNALLELNGITAGDQLQNEIFILQSHRLIERVVTRLKLDVDYSVKNGLGQSTLYKKRPFEATFLRPAEIDEDITFKVDLIDNQKFRIFDVRYKDEDCRIDKVVAYGQRIATPAGNVYLTRKMNLEGLEPTTVTVSRLPVFTATEMYRSKLSCGEINKESSLIVLTFQDTNKKRAEDFLNVLLDVYKEDIIDGKNRIAESTAIFIDSRIKIIGDELNDVEGSLARFKERNQIVDFEKSAQSALEEQRTLRLSMLQAEVQLSVAEYLEDFLKNNSKADQVIPVLNDMVDQGIQQQITEYNKLVLERNRLAPNTGENSPVMNDLNQKLIATNEAIRASVHSLVNTLRLRAESARRNENTFNTMLSGVPNIEKSAGDIKRQQEIKSALYSYLLNKREEVALQLAINEANIRTVEYPLGSERPVAPHSMIIMAIGLFIGILIPTAVFTIRSYMDTAVRGRKDIEDATDLNVIGEIPRWEDANKLGDSETLIATDETNNTVTEAFRMLRYGLSFIRKHNQVVMCTSATPGQGKTFVSRNLAAILARADKRVILIDADIRKRTQSKQLGNRFGLTSYLNGDITRVEEIIISRGGTNLQDVDFIPAGLLPPNPAELLMDARFDELIDELRSRYDYIIIDTTPALQVADAGIVSRVADQTLFIIRVGVQDRHFLPTLQRLSDDKQLGNISVVLNDCVNNVLGYGYGYGYGYGHTAGRQNHAKHGNKSSGLSKKLSAGVLHRLNNRKQ